jgi:hypothetical protein
MYSLNSGFETRVSHQRFFVFSLVPGSTELVSQNRKKPIIFQNHSLIRNDTSNGKYEGMRPVLTYAKSLYPFLFVTNS